MMPGHDPSVCAVCGKEKWDDIGPCPPSQCDGTHQATRRLPSNYAVLSAGYSLLCDGIVERHKAELNGNIRKVRAIDSAMMSRAFGEPAALLLAAIRSVHVDRAAKTIPDEFCVVDWRNDPKTKPCPTCGATTGNPCIGVP